MGRRGLRVSVGAKGSPDPNGLRVCVGAKGFSQYEVF